MTNSVAKGKIQTDSIKDTLNRRSGPIRRSVTSVGEEMCKLMEDMHGNWRMDSNGHMGTHQMQYIHLNGDVSGVGKLIQRTFGGKKGTTSHNIMVTDLTKDWMTLQGMDMVKDEDNKSNAANEVLFDADRKCPTRLESSC